MKKPVLLLFLTISTIFILFSRPVSAADFSFYDDFSGDFNIDKNLSNYKFASGAISAPDNFVSAGVVSTPLINTSYNIGSAKLEISDSAPTGGRIVYFASNDDGKTWTEAPKNVFVNFSSFGKSARWSAVIARADASAVSPEIHSIKITVSESDPTLSADNDSRRISDLSAVAAAISDFYRDYGIYPHVSDTLPLARWNELMALLSRNRNGGRESYPYLSYPVNDPLNGSDGQTYDYKDLSPNDFILAAVLESPHASALGNDYDGNSYGINCDDPVYCVGVLRNAGGFYQNQNSGGSGTVLGASTSVYASSFYGQNATVMGLLGFDSLVRDNELNDVIGREIFRRGRFLETSFSAKNEGEPAVNAGNKNSNARVAGASTVAKAGGVNTGIAGSVMLSAILSLAVAFFFTFRVKNESSGGRQALATIQKHRQDKNRFNFAL